MSYQLYLEEDPEVILIELEYFFQKLIQMGFLVIVFSLMLVIQSTLQKQTTKSQ